MHSGLIFSANKGLQLCCRHRKDGCSSMRVLSGRGRNQCRKNEAGKQGKNCDGVKGAGFETNVFLFSCKRLSFFERNVFLFNCKMTGQVHLQTLVSKTQT